MLEIPKYIPVPRVTKEHARKAFKNNYNEEQHGKKNSGQKKINKFH